MKIACYALNSAGAPSGNRRAHHIAQAFAEGARRHGLQAQIYTRFNGIEGDIAVAYGWIHESTFNAYKAAGKHFAYWDLGYWGRQPATGKTVEGYHRLAVDDWDTLVNMRRDCPSDRWERLDVHIRKPVTGMSRILVAGMSAKAAITHGYRENQWEDMIRRQIFQAVPQAEVDFRAKPNKRVRQIMPIEQALETTHLLVTHHSNAALDALVAGVPVYCRKGIGRLASPDELDEAYIRNPVLPSIRRRLAILADAAYAQWTPDEMRSGEAWEHICDVLERSTVMQV
jgi:hypothetical protein